MPDTTLFDTWYNNKWLPIARKTTNDLAVLSRYLGKQSTLPSKEARNGLSAKFVEIRDNLSKINEELINLEQGDLS